MYLFLLRLMEIYINISRNQFVNEKIKSGCIKYPGKWLVEIVKE